MVGVEVSQSSVLDSMAPSSALPLVFGLTRPANIGIDP